MAYPKDFRYSREHEWLALQGDAAKIGITDFAQHQLGDIVFVELPAVGAELVAGQAFGTVESVKAVSEVFSPISGKVTAINEALAKSPEKLNQDPHGAAWLIQASVSDPGPAAKLMDAAAYEKFVAEEEAGH
ncbi:MAG: glycine cleavage system protein GcvH [Terriglobales bacterium]